MDSWLAQARRGVVELCTLALIARGPQYGYQLALALSHWSPLAITEGTLYPLLRRLQREGLIDASWQPSQDGPPRKYYRLTPAGQALLETQLADWRRLTEAVDILLNDEEVPNGSGSERQRTLPTHAARAPEPTARG
jgi:PadR family transcriptional regulator PadR